VGSVRVFQEPNRTEPKKSQTEPDRTEWIFKNFEPNRTEPKKFQTEPNRGELKRLKSHYILVKTFGDKINSSYSLNKSLLLFYHNTCEREEKFFRSISYMYMKTNFLRHVWHCITAEWQKWLKVTKYDWEWRRSVSLLYISIKISLFKNNILSLSFFLFSFVLLHHTE
jgi:hypothetical protein